MNREVLPIEESYWVIPGRFRAGKYPASVSENETRKMLNWLMEQGINFMIDLTEEGETGINSYPEVLVDETEKNQLEIEYQRKAIQDFSVPATEMVTEILDEIDKALEIGKNIYLHCQGGRGRTGLIVGCYLVRHGSTGHQALRLIQTLRSEIPGEQGVSPETEGQKRMVMEWKQGQ